MVGYREILVPSVSTQKFKNSETAASNAKSTTGPHSADQHVSPSEIPDQIDEFDVFYAENSPWYDSLLT